MPTTNHLVATAYEYTLEVLGAERGGKARARMAPCADPLEATSPAAPST